MSVQTIPVTKTQIVLILRGPMTVFAILATLAMDITSALVFVLLFLLLIICLYNDKLYSRTQMYFSWHTTFHHRTYQQLHTKFCFTLYTSYRITFPLVLENPKYFCAMIYYAIRRKTDVFQL